MKSTLRKVSDWLGKQNWNVNQIMYNPKFISGVAALVFIITVFAIGENVGHKRGIQHVTEGNFIIQKFDDVTVLTDPEGNKQVYQNAVTVEFNDGSEMEVELEYKPEPIEMPDNGKSQPDICAEDKDGFPKSYTMLKRGEKWGFRDNDGHVFTSTFDSRERTILQAQSWCIHDNAQEIPWEIER
jgi:hypothetical protein